MSKRPCEADSPGPECQLAARMRGTSCRPAFTRHQLHRAVFDSNPCGVTVLDVNGRLVESNPAADRIFGQHELDGRAFDAEDWVICDLDGKSIPSDQLPFDIVRRTGQPLSNFRHSIRTPQGRTVFLSISGQPLLDDAGVFAGAVFSLMDITPEIAAERQIAEARQRLELAIHGTDLGTWDWDVGSGRVVFNDRWATMLGYQPNEIEPHVDSWSRLVHPDDVELVGVRIKEHFSGMTEIYECEHRIRSKSGEWRWILDRGRVITRDANGVPIRVVGTHQDTTDRRRAEEELKRAKEAAEAANRTKGEFLANISHEIRTPMNAILGFADVLRDESLTADERSEYIATIRRNGEHLMSLLNDVLDISKIEAGALSVERLEVAPAAIVEDTASLLRLRCESKGLSLMVQIAPDTPATIIADPTRVRQVLLNLIGNAIKFTHEGQITVRCGVRDGVLAIEVADTGIGISDDERERLFTPFTQADMTVTRRFGGTGLGLAISRRLATMMGGDLTVQSQLHVGSTFTLTLPLGPNQESPRDPVTIARDDSTQWLVGRRVLIVDDAPDNQLLVRYLLARRGMACEVAGDGDAAIRLATSERFDAILMDMQMPVLDGYTATRAIRDAGIDIPIIALTANALADDARKCRDAGCDLHLPKPVHADTLVQMLASALRPATT